MKIRTRLLCMVIVGLIPMWIGLGVITRVARGSDMEKTLDLIEEYSEGIASDFEAFFGDAEQAAIYLAAMQRGAQLSWSEGASEMFEEFALLNDDIYAMAYIEADGSYYATSLTGNPWQGGRMTEDNSDPEAAPISAEGLSYFRALVTDNARAEFFTFVSEPYIPRGRSDKCIITAAPVISAGRVEGVVCATQTSAEISALYTNVSADFMDRFGADARMCLLSDGGQLVADLQYNPSRRAYEDVTFGTSEILSFSTLPPELLAAFGESRDSGGIIRARLSGERCFVSSLRIGETPFTLGLAVPERAMLAASRLIGIVGTILYTVISAWMFASTYFMLREMLSSLRKMSRGMAEIAEGSGDLSARLDVGGDDELAEIGGNFNRFTGTLHDMIGDVSKSAEAMSSIGQTLYESSREIAGDIASISHDVENLNFTVEEQSASVSETSATITQIAQNIESLTSQIEAQSSAVTESSASVQQMVSNVGSISESLSKASGGFAELRSNAAAGKGSIGAVQELVNKLAAQSDSLLEANSVIENIASQTNLLAMNAAIEAAHAGEAGKGFAVVADEIRKLAESSSGQSKTIAAGLKSAVNSIRSIADATSVADSSFDAVASKIDAVTSLVSSIDLAMQEQREGSRQVLEALRDIESITVQIRDGSVEMNSGTETILKEITRLSGVSQSVQERSASIARAVDAISSAVEKISKGSISNKDAIDVLASITGKFKL